MLSILIGIKELYFGFESWEITENIIQILTKKADKNADINNFVHIVTIFFLRW